MPRIFDNIDQDLLPVLQETLKISQRADFCVGFFNLRGWKKIDNLIERWGGGDGNCCRLLVGMQSLPKTELEESFSILHGDEGIDQGTALRKKRELADEFRNQLMVGMPSNDDEAGLRRLSKQLRSNKVQVKLFLRHRLHAKLYLLFRPDPNNPITGFLGSSNLTFAGLQQQGELNIDVMDHDACNKLKQWFEDRWNDRFCIDISNELADIIDESWASEVQRSPYHIYLKIAFHLCAEARSGQRDFRLPREFEEMLFEFQKAAVRIAARHLHKRGGVLIGDVVGLGKSLMATALAKMFEDDQGLEALILCPKNLVPMWTEYRERYRLRGKVMSTSVAMRELPHEIRYRIVLIDESHNMRNREGKRYKAIHEYIDKNDSKVILLTATPYNKAYVDLSNQLRLFLKEDEDLGIRPEKYIRQIGGETEFIRKHQCSVKSLAAFEKSDNADDWRDLMKQYMVRRTRTFVKENYADVDCTQCRTRILATESQCSACGGQRPSNARAYLTFTDGTRAPFPTRVPRTVGFSLEGDGGNQYASLYSDSVVNRISGLDLPRYGLGNYIRETPDHPPTSAEAKIINDLSRAGKRLIGFCRTNLFKRVESCGDAFISSVKRHIVRNYVYLHALDNDLPVPIGTQDVSLLDTTYVDSEYDLFDDDTDDSADSSTDESEREFQDQARQIYGLYQSQYVRRFRWLPASRFVRELRRDLLKDTNILIEILDELGEWRPENDPKLSALVELISQSHPQDKVLIFTQFADTVDYLIRELRALGFARVESVTGGSANPTRMAHRFSPISNHKSLEVSAAEEIRVLIATDVLSEGQNLQDGAIVVNFDIPWAIIRLIQRAGRVDRIGQQSHEILCYTFLPAEGVERIIRLRSRIRQRLQENAEVVGTDEAFFEDDSHVINLSDLYNERAGILDGEAETEIDLGSYAYQIWANAIKIDPSLAKTVSSLPNVIFSTKPHEPTDAAPAGVLVYARTSDDHDALAWVDHRGNNVTESQYTILRAAECLPETPALPRHEGHHELVRHGVEQIAKQEKQIGGQLGKASGARFRTYERLKSFADIVVRDFPLFPVDELKRTVDEIYANPLRPLATDILNRLLKSGISDEDLANRVIELRGEGRLCVSQEQAQEQEPQVICSLGLRQPD